jgi:hypothetical protein
MELRPTFGLATARSPDHYASRGFPRDHVEKNPTGEPIRVDRALGRGHAMAGILRAAELCSGRGLPVRLEPRGRSTGRRDGDREGCPCSALPQYVLRRAYPRETQEMVFDAHYRAFTLFKGSRHRVTSSHPKSGWSIG